MKPTQKAHEEILKVRDEFLNKGEQVFNSLDLTAGNGHDTLFLATTVSNSSSFFPSVIAFDIQRDAILATEERLLNNGFNSENSYWKEITYIVVGENKPCCCVYLINDSHKNVRKPTTVKITPKTFHFAMFNLGYLPNADKTVITQPKTTIKALRGVLKLLVSGGIVTMVLYSGHEGGDTEREAVIKYLNKLNKKKFKVTQFKEEIERNSELWTIIKI
ncbi:MAG: class I SAM-dependent methyltransferase [Firmicutes bacterium]|nr:class I SAM-dependent methyltransferase [Bacillota bacterium]